MKVKLLTSIAGANYSHKYGDIVDLPEAQAIAYLAAELPLAEAIAELTDAEQKSIAGIRKARAEEVIQEPGPDINLGDKDATPSVASTEKAAVGSKKKSKKAG